MSAFSVFTIRFSKHCNAGEGGRSAFGQGTILCPPTIGTHFLKGPSLELTPVYLDCDFKRFMETLVFEKFVYGFAYDRPVHIWYNDLLVIW